MALNHDASKNHHVQERFPLKQESTFGCPTLCAMKLRNG